MTLETQFSESGQDAPWKNDVAKELNLLLWQVQWASTLKDRRATESAAVSIVDRVADFEDITVLKGEE